MARKYAADDADKQIHLAIATDGMQAITEQYHPQIVPTCTQEGSINKKIVPHNGNPPRSHLGATEEPPGSTLLDPMAPGAPQRR